MKAFFLFLGMACLIVNGFSQHDILLEKSHADSSSSFIKFLDQQNLLISQAYNEIGKGLQAERPDSLVLTLINYKTVCESVFTNVSGILVAGHLNSVKISYCQWIRSIIEFNELHLMKLEEYQLSKERLLQNNPEADTKYAEGQIQDIFKQMDEAQNNTRSNYMLELENLRQFHLREAENKK